MSSEAAFRRLDELMSRQPPGKKIPCYAPMNPAQPVPPGDSFAAMWDEMWGLWFPRPPAEPVGLYQDIEVAR